MTKIKRVLWVPLHLIVLLTLAAAWITLFAAWLATWILHSFHEETAAGVGRCPVIPRVSLDLSGRQR
ncbi:hypothetical protein ACWDKQ_34445 [Saccharopolyspora sp. NPDC000995]